VLNGCKNLRKLVIRDGQFGDGALLADVTKYDTIQSLWISRCQVTVGGCKTLATENPRLSVELIPWTSSDARQSENNQRARNVYVYPTVAGRRTDAPHFVSIV
jgi:hypothetical protein